MHQINNKSLEHVTDLCKKLRHTALVDHDALDENHHFEHNFREQMVNMYITKQAASAG